MTKEGRINYNAEVNNVLKTQGMMGLYRGFWSTFWRDVPNWGLYFFTYQWLKNKDKVISNRIEGWS
jgi:solute carrier family 25 carnitine/acylcarnitine transporter 20/29